MSRKGYGASGVVRRRDLRPAPLTPLQVAGARVVQQARVISFPAWRARLGVRDLSAFRVATALLERNVVHLSPTRDLVWGPEPEREE